MKLDRDGVLSILLGIALVLGMWGVEYYFFAKEPIAALIALVKDLIVGTIAGVGLLLIAVGVLFILAW